MYNSSDVQLPIVKWTGSGHAFVRKTLSPKRCQYLMVINLFWITVLTSDDTILHHSTIKTLKLCFPWMQQNQTTTSRYMSKRGQLIMPNTALLPSDQTLITGLSLMWTVCAYDKETVQLSTERPSMSDTFVSPGVWWWNDESVRKVKGIDVSFSSASLKQLSEATFTRQSILINS